MADDAYVWVVCMVHRRLGMTTLGIYTLEQAMVEAVRLLPRDRWYNLYRLPLNQFTGYWNKEGQLLDGLGKFWHHHLVPAVEDGSGTWGYIDGWPDSSVDRRMAGVDQADD